MTFDIEGAKKSGYSDEEIVQHLSQTRGFDYQDAIKSGYSPSEVLTYLSQTNPLPPPSNASNNEPATGEGPLGSLVSVLSNPSQIGKTLSDAGNQVVRGVNQMRENVSQQMQPGFQESPEQTAQAMQSARTGVMGLLGGGALGGQNAVQGGATTAAVAINSIPSNPPTGLQEFLTNKLPRKLYEGISKWSTVIDQGTTADPGLRQKLTDTVMNEKLPWSQEGYDKLVATARSYDAGIKNMVSNTPNVLIPRSGLYGDVIQAIDSQSGKVGDVSLKTEMLDKFSNMVKDTSTLQNPLMTVEDAQALKQSLNQKLDSYFAQINKVGSSATPEAEVGVWNAVRSALKKQIENAIPGVAQLNSKEGALLSLQPFMAQGLNRTANRSVLGISDMFASALGGAVSTASGAGPTLGALIGYGAKKTLASPEMLSKYALALNGLRTAGIPNLSAMPMQSVIQLYNSMGDKVNIPENIMNQFKTKKDINIDNVRQYVTQGEK